jgi:hypothetical protein
MVDTRDLKSLGHNGRAGSSPVPGTAKSFQALLIHSAGLFFCTFFLISMPTAQPFPGSGLSWKIVVFNKACFLIQKRVIWPLKFPQGKVSAFLSKQ